MVVMVAKLVWNQKYVSDEQSRLFVIFIFILLGLVDTETFYHMLLMKKMVYCLRSAAEMIFFFVITVFFVW